MGGGVAQELEGEFDVVKSGKLSALQLEAIAYACQAHETRLPDGSRAGFFIGDGAGVRHSVAAAVVVVVNLNVCDRSNVCSVNASCLKQPFSSSCLGGLLLSCPTVCV